MLWIYPVDRLSRRNAEYWYRLKAELMGREVVWSHSICPLPAFEV